MTSDALPPPFPVAWLRIAVVTRVCADESGGNLALPMLPLLIADDGGGITAAPLAAANPMLVLSLRQPVFHLGEILVLGTDGREPHGLGRMPGKWDVGIEIVPDIATAVSLAQTVKMASEPPI